MKFNANEIGSLLVEEISNFQGQVETREVGKVLEVGDGIARVHGLSSAMAGEMVEFPGGVRGQVFNLEETSVGIIILGDYKKIQEGDEVRATGALLSVPVGEALIGRVVDPLGNPLDGAGPINATETRPLESEAPGVAGRQPVKQPLQTGIKAIDAMTPVGRGQRELIIGDRKTGKTAIAIDTIINQKGKDVICIYVGSGQRSSNIASVVEVLRENGRDGLHHRSGRRGQRSGSVAIHRPLCRGGDGRILYVSRQTHLGGVRRSFQASPSVSAIVALNATTAGTRSLSW